MGLKVVSVSGSGLYWKVLRTRTRSSVLMGTSYVWDGACDGGGGWTGDGCMGQVEVVYR
jgi:hypothetical protein